MDMHYGIFNFFFQNQFTSQVLFYTQRLEDSDIIIMVDTIMVDIMVDIMGDIMGDITKGLIQDTVVESLLGDFCAAKGAAQEYTMCKCQYVIN